MGRRKTVLGRSKQAWAGVKQAWVAKKLAWVQENWPELGGRGATENFAEKAGSGRKNWRGDESAWPGDKKAGLG